MLKSFILNLMGAAALVIVTTSLVLIVAFALSSHEAPDTRGDAIKVINAMQSQL